MVRRQDDGTYPAAFARITSPVLMIHGTFDPHPGPMIEASLRPFIPQMEYLPLERCGHEPWKERAAAEGFYGEILEWVG